ncbi:MAG TPA: cellulase family glycosylhydrolase [Streptosporangiaceae bacterium]
MRSGRRLSWGTALCGVLLVVLAAVVPVVWAGPAGSGAVTTCEHPVPHQGGPFSVAPDRRSALDRTGHPFVSYGTTVAALTSPLFATYPGYVEALSRRVDMPKINATAGAWCGNTVRIQIAQANVTPNGRTCHAAFLSQALDGEVRDAEDHHLVVVINDDTETDPRAAQQRDPTPATLTFWRCVAQHRENWPGGVAYGRDPQLIFDLFNEPQADACARSRGGHGPDGPYDLALWRDGGRFTGCGQHNAPYIGMQAVVTDVRADGARNLLWIEGPGSGNSLTGLTGPASRHDRDYLISDPLGKVVYAIHHPYAGRGAPPDPATWRKEFGYLVQGPQAIAPVVVGEWTNFTAAQLDVPYCWANAPQSVPEFLDYLAIIHAGLNAYQLDGGTLLRADGPPWTDTTNYTSARWRSSYCRYSSGWVPPLLGAGQDVLTWFRNQG